MSDGFGHRLRGPIHSIFPGKIFPDKSILTKHIYDISKPPICFPPLTLLFEYQSPEVNLEMGDYYLDGPVFLKSGVSLIGDWSEDDSPYETVFHVHGSGTGADGVINADGVSGAYVSLVMRNTAGSFTTFGDRCTRCRSIRHVTTEAYRNRQLVILKSLIHCADDTATCASGRNTDRVPSTCRFRTNHSTSIL